MKQGVSDKVKDTDPTGTVYKDKVSQYNLSDIVIPHQSISLEFRPDGFRR